MKYKHFVHNYVLNPRHQLTVDVIGVGGTGSQVLTALGRMSYALTQLGHPGLHVRAYDGDIVTQANFGRQLFAPQEVGLNKANVMITKLNMFFGTAWESFPEMFNERTESSNIIISCVDTAKSRLVIKSNLSNGNAFRGDQRNTFYWLDFGNMVDRGQVVLGTPHVIEQPKRKRGCVDYLRTCTDMFDLTKVDEKKSGPSCSLAEALSKQDLFINSTLANIGMALMWKMFTKGVLDVQGAYLNLDTMRVNPIRVDKC